MSIKKSQPKNKSSVRAGKVTVKKITGTSPISAPKTAKKPSSAKTEKQTGSKGKATVTNTKAPAKKKTTSVSPVRTSGKKNITGKVSKTAKKTGGKKPLKVVKAGKKTRIKPSRPKTEPKSVAVKSATKKIKLSKAPEVKKTAKGKGSITKPEKTSYKIARGKKITDKKPAKTTSRRKAVIPEKKPVKKSPAKSVAVTAATIKMKTSSSKALPRIKETAKKKTALKPKGKAEAPVSTVRKKAKKKGTSPLITSEPLSAISKKRTAVSTAVPQDETTPKKSAKLKIFLPEEELPSEEAQRPAVSGLPGEYGENELLLMEVDPSVVFVSWEIKPDDISGKKGKLTLRVYDVTGMDFDGSHANRFFDISLRNRVGSRFIDIKMPGKDVIMEVGLLHPKGVFRAIKRSNRVSMPALQTFEELGITGVLSDPDTFIGY